MVGNWVRRCSKPPQLRQAQGRDDPLEMDQPEQRCPHLVLRWIRIWPIERSRHDRQAQPSAFWTVKPSSASFCGVSRPRRTRSSNSSGALRYSQEANRSPSGDDRLERRGLRTLAARESPKADESQAKSEVATNRLVVAVLLYKNDASKASFANGSTCCELAIENCGL
jgi:hypothetical protein